MICFSVAETRLSFFLSLPASWAARPECQSLAIVVPLQDVVVGAGELALFECLVAGPPDMDVDWLSRGRLLQPALLKCKMHFDGRKCKLLLTSVHEDDSGIYTCKLSTAKGKRWSHRSCGEGLTQSLLLGWCWGWKASLPPGLVLWSPWDIAVRAGGGGQGVVAAPGAGELSSAGKPGVHQSLGSSPLSPAAPILPHSAPLQTCTQLPEMWGGVFVP